MIYKIKMEKWAIEDTVGYKPITTFFQDFCIAEAFGESAIRDTYDRSFEEWRNDYKFITELVLVLNWRHWRWFRVNDEYSRIYGELDRKLDDWAMDNLKGEELEYYIHTTD